MIRRSVNLTLAGSLAAAVASLGAVGVAQAQETVKCYGVALKGQNDCKAGSHDCKGTSKIDYDGQSFKLVAKGTCTTMETPNGMGSLTPFENKMEEM